VTKKALAQAVATAAAPELAVPLELVRRVLSEVRPSPAQSTEGAVVLVPPADRLVWETAKQKIHVIERNGVKLVMVDRAKGLTAKELVGLMVLSLGGLEALNLWAQGYHPEGGNPGTWFPQLWLGRTFWDDVTAKLEGHN